jgi:hypothetical protein
MKRLLVLLSAPLPFILSVLTMAAFMILVLPGKALDAADYTPPGAGFDTAGFYSPAQAIERVAAYSTEGRAAYVHDRWTFDLAFPLVYGCFMCCAWAFGLARLTRLARLTTVSTGLPVGLSRGESLRVIRKAPAAAGDRLAWLLIIPLLGVICDFIENSAVTILMLAYPEAPLPAALAASAGTALKWIFVGIGLTGAIVLPVAAGITGLWRRATQK